MGIKYSMDEFIKYFVINTVGNSKQGFTDLNASGIITIADDNMQDPHSSCIAGYDSILYAL